MKQLTDLLPLGIGVALVGALTWFLLDRNWALGRWLLAALVFFHGWVHLMFVFPQPEPSAGGPAWPFDMARSWLVTGPGLDVGLVRTIGIAVMIVAFAGLALSALATVNLLVPASWWSGLLIGSACASTLLLALFFSPTLLLGVAIDVALLWFVLASAWSPVAAATAGRGGIG